MKHPKRLLSALFCLCSAASLYALSEETIKSAYLERFAMFVKWPKPVESYSVCIYNDEEFAGTLRKNYSSRLFNGRPLTVISLKVGEGTDAMQKCHILYFRGSKPYQNETILNSLRKNSVLVISDNDGDTKQGAMIGFYLENNTFRFVLNQRNFDNANLDVSYKLLNFATVIEPTGGSK
jgi:hypothetical protein